jgi:elongation factor G
MVKKREAPIQNVRILGILPMWMRGKRRRRSPFFIFTGRIHRAGNVDDGNTQWTLCSRRRERGITNMFRRDRLSWQGHRLNIIDTPGHIDFTAEVVRSNRVI